MWTIGLLLHNKGLWETKLLGKWSHRWTWILLKGGVEICRFETQCQAIYKRQSNSPSNCWHSTMLIFFNEGNVPFVCYWYAASLLLKVHVFQVGVFGFKFGINVFIFVNRFEISCLYLTALADSWWVSATYINIYVKLVEHSCKIKLFGTNFGSQFSSMDLLSVFAVIYTIFDISLPNNWRAPWKNGLSDDFEKSLLSCVLSASVSFQTFAK